MDLNIILELFAAMTIILFILIIYTIYRHNKQLSLNNSNFSLRRQDLFNCPPGVVNAYFKNQGGEIFNGDKDGFKATLLDLINKNYIMLLNPDINNPIKKNGDFNGPLIKINRKKKIKKLKSYEIDVINFLRKFDKKGLISLYYLKDDLKNVKASRAFQRSYGLWENHLKGEHFENNHSLSEDLMEFKKEWDDFKSYISVSDMDGAKISSSDVNQYLVYAVALGIEKKAIKNFEKHLPQTILKNSGIYQICKAHGLNFVEEGLKKPYLIKSGQHDEYTDVYGYG